MFLPERNGCQWSKCPNRLINCSLFFLIFESELVGKDGKKLRTQLSDAWTKAKLRSRCEPQTIQQEAASRFLKAKLLDLINILKKGGWLIKSNDKKTKLRVRSELNVI